MEKFIKIFFDINKLETSANGRFVKVIINNNGVYLFSFSSLIGIKSGKPYLVIPTQKEFNVFVDKNGVRENVGKIKGEELIKSPFNLGEYKLETKQTKTIEMI